ncbi:unnamed protein product [[Candida] boidinii]|nr:unnamed protein product [[Candida] boidinii]
MDNESRSTNSQHNSPYNASNFMSTAADLEYSILGSIIQDNRLLSPDAIMLSPSFSPDENNFTNNNGNNGNNNISENNDSIFNKYKPFLGPSNLHTVYNNDNQGINGSNQGQLGKSNSSGNLLFGPQPQPQSSSHNSKDTISTISITTTASTLKSTISVS